MPKIILKREPILEAKAEAYAFQAQTVRAIRDLEYSAIFHEQGLGKSKIAIDLMLYWLSSRLIDTVLFVAKKGLVRNWEREFSAHTHMKPRLISQNGRANYYAFNSPSRLMLTHYEVLVSEKERLTLFLRARDVGVILDESAKIKNPDSTITRACFELAPLFKRRVIMTGTPVANRPYDIWAQIRFLDQGKSLGDDFAAFRRELDLANDLGENAEHRCKFENALRTLFSRIAAFSVRQTKQSGVIELPHKTIHTITTEWEPTQYELYCQIRNEMRATVVREGLEIEDDSEVALKRLLRLVQVASNPRLIDENYRAGPGKLIPLMDLVTEITNKGEKCIVWTAFTANADWLAVELRSHGTVKVHGKIAIDQRNRALEQFQDDPTTRVLIATPGAAKEGLTLTVANHVIFFDRSFSLDDYLQSQDRIHRISQNKLCHVYNLIMRNSIDEWVDILLHSKQLAAQLAQGDVSLDVYRRGISYDFGRIVAEILGLHSEAH